MKARLRLTTPSRRKNTLLALAAPLYLASLACVLFDPDLDYRWVAFSLWMAAVILASAGLRRDPARRADKLTAEDRLWCLLPVTAAILVNFPRVRDFPFMVSLDEIQAGLFGRDIALGTLRQIFGYGHYNGGGLSSETVNALFYSWFGADVMTIRGPGPFVGTLDCALLYFVVRRRLGRATAVWASLILATLPLHIYFARVFSINIFTSLWTVALLALLDRAIRSLEWRSCAALGVVCGFVGGFQAAAWIPAYLSLLMLGVTLGGRLARGKVSGRAGALCALALVCGYLVGFGPRILVTSLPLLFHVERIPLVQSPEPLRAVLPAWGQSYVDTLKAIAHTPTFGYFERPLIDTRWLGPVFYVGVACAAWRAKEIFPRILLLALATLPLMSSAITNVTAASHRLVPLLPVISVLMALALATAASAAKRVGARLGAGPAAQKLLPLAIALVGAAGVVSHGVNYFVEELPSYSDAGDRIGPLPAYLRTYALPEIGKRAAFTTPSTVCFGGSPATMQVFRLMHSMEIADFFLNGYALQFQVVEGASDRELYLSPRCPADPRQRAEWTKLPICESYRKFVCPPDRMPLTLFIDPNSNT